SAAPGVAGVCALILEANPRLTQQEVKDILRITADKIDTDHGHYDRQGHSHWYGYGRVNAGNAVKMAIRLRRSVK
ncbi:MAG: S8 family serine peptidase, partial [Bacteroidia bacterium]